MTSQPRRKEESTNKKGLNMTKRIGKQRGINNFNILLTGSGIGSLWCPSCHAGPPSNMCRTNAKIHGNIIHSVKMEINMKFMGLMYLVGG